MQSGLKETIVSLSAISTFLKYLLDLKSAGTLYTFAWKSEPANFLSELCAVNVWVHFSLILYDFLYKGCCLHVGVSNFHNFSLHEIAVAQFSTRLIFCYSSAWIPFTALPVDTYVSYEFTLTVQGYNHHHHHLLLPSPHLTYVAPFTLAAIGCCVGDNLRFCAQRCHQNGNVDNQLLFPIICVYV